MNAPVLAAIGAVERWWYGRVEVRLGALFAAAGMLTAPAGGWLGGHLPPQTLMVAFAGLMVPIAARMWHKSSDQTERAAAGVFAAGGGVPALFVGSWIGRRIGGPTLARVFSIAIVLVAAFIIFKNATGI